MTKNSAIKTCTCCNKIFKSDSDYLLGTSRWRKDSEEYLFFNCECGTTLVLPKGKYSWYDPTKSMSEEGIGIFNKIMHIKQIPLLPKVLLEFERLLGDENIEFHVLADCIKQDPFFSAQILGLANIRVADENGEIKSIQHALSVLGRTTLQSLVSVATMQLLKPETQYFTPKKILLEAYLAGNICVKINTMCAPNNACMTDDEAFMYGSLATSLGKLIASFYFPDKTDAVYLRSMLPTRNTTWTEAEKVESAYPYTTLGEIAGALWGYPSKALKHIRLMNEQTHPSFDLSDFNRNNIIRLSSNITQLMMNSSAQGYIHEIDETLSIMELKKDFVQQIKTEMKPVMEQIIKNMERTLLNSTKK